MIWIGTSGYNYPEWKGHFYPERLPPAKMLAYYAERLSSVEINYTFYRMPTPAVVSGWTAATPKRFAFALKAPQRITHVARLQNCGPLLRRFCETASLLGDKLGVILFQLPPNLKLDLARLESFLDALPPRARVAVEFRHPSWHAPDVFAALERRGAALCIADSEKLSTPVRVTADHAYFRLRDEGYGPADLARWARTIRESTTRCRDVYVYFKHEEAGRGPAFARTLEEELSWEGGSRRR